MLRISLIFLLLVIICPVFVFAQKVLLRDVKTLTLHKGQQTTGRRSSPQPQLKCIGGPARGKFEPRTAQCYNRGDDGTGNVQWECKAEMSDEFEFGKIFVSCEGYDYPDDPYILQGSCGLEYDLEYTTTGRKSHHRDAEDKGSGWLTLITMLFVLFILYLVFLNFGPRPGYEGDRERFGSGFDGGPGFPPGPPPPYDDHPPFKRHSTTSQGYQPGFWSGAGLGALGGYFLGRNSAAGPSTSSWRATPSSSSQFRRDTGFGSSDQPSTSTHESTAYGSTRRR